MPGQEDMRPVPQGPLLPHRDPVRALSGGVILSERGFGADAVPCKPVLPAGVAKAKILPAWKAIGSGVQVSAGMCAVRRGGVDRLNFVSCAHLPVHVHPCIGCTALIV